MAISNTGKKVNDVFIMTLNTPAPRYRVLPKSFSVNGMANCETLIQEQIPEPINDAAEIAYCSRSGHGSGPKPQTANRKISKSGVMRPPTMAKAC
jgi:hypothetical protein